VRIINERLLPATFLARPNRFVVECTIEGREVKAYLPNPGRLWELLHPGTALLVTKNPPGSGMGYTVMALVKDGTPLLLHTHVTNGVAERLLKEGLVPGLEDARVVRREVTFGHSRFDFLLNKNGGDLVLEVKNCTLFGDTLAMFPDAVTARGTRHVEGLLELAGRGVQAGVLFIVQWPRVRYFMPEYHTDLDFSRALLKARDRLTIKAVSVEWNPDLTLGSTVRELSIPWPIVEKNTADRGCYLVILRLESDMRIAVGGLGEPFFKGGYYVYVGSARRGLTMRMARHSRRRKRFFWHIDYLRNEALFCRALAIRTERDIECRIASGLAGMADWSIRGFGSSDCTCPSHLFGMERDPVHVPAFIELLCQYRIGLVEEELTDDR
jgi:sugar fermentation stimulation protein A